MKKIAILNVVLLLTLILASCAPAATPTVAPTLPPAPTNTAVPPTNTPVPPTKAPEPTKATDATKPPVATAAPASAYTLTITLKKGLKWSDDSALTTKDIVGTYNIYWTQASATWGFIDSIVAKDDVTVDFNLNQTAGIRALMAIMRTNIIRPYSQYGKYMDAAADLMKKKADVKGDEVKKFLDDLYSFKPTDTVVSGPYKIDPKSVTEAQVTLLKNPKGYAADKVGYDKLIMYYGETIATVPLILSGDVDYATHAFPPANITTFKSLPNYKLLGGTTATGPGLWFNQTVYPLNKVEVRQAFAYIIDRKENATIAFGDAGKPIQYMAGFTDAMVPTWLTKDAIDKLNPYNKDLKKAEDLLTKSGAKKGADGIWVDDKGKKMEFELSVPSDFADWFATAENAAQQLTKAGIKTTVRGYQSADRATVQSDGKYQILVDLTTYTSPPHPSTSFNYVLNTPRNNPNPDNKAAGMNYSWKQTGPDGKEFDVLATITSAASGLDNEKQKPFLATLAWLLNNQLPYLPLWERIATDPINVANQTGWLPFEDKIYKNNQGSDNYVAIQILDGTVKPSAANTTKKFASAYPYTQPPKGSLNLFATDSIPTTLGTVYYPLEYPPLFWYMWADNAYAPVLAEKYDLKTNK